MEKASALKVVEHELPWHFLQTRGDVYSTYVPEVVPHCVVLFFNLKFENDRGDLDQSAPLILTH